MKALELLGRLSLNMCIANPMERIAISGTDVYEAIAELEEAMKPKTCKGCVREAEDMKDTHCVFCSRSCDDKFEPKGQRMTTKEAMQSMLDGKKVRNKMWSSYIYMYFDGDILLDSNGNKFNNLSMSFTDCWEIYEEPKPKQTVTIEKWLLSTSNGYIVRELSETAVNMLYEAKEKVKLLETYEVTL